MRRIHILPIHRVNKGAKVILYGAGQIGRALWQHNEDISWCNISFVVDKNYKNINGFPVKVYDPDIIIGLDGYDFIIIAMSSKRISEEVRDNFLQMGVAPNKIILEREYECYDYSMNEVTTYKDSISNKIAFLVWGGIGDHVVQLKVYQKLIELFPNCMIDIYSSNIYYAESIYHGQKQIGEIFPHSKLEKSCDKYDLTIASDWEINLVNVNQKFLENTEEPVKEKVKELIRFKEKQSNKLEILENYMRDSLRLRQAEFNGWNRYTMLDRSGVLEITDKKVEIYLHEGYKQKFQNLHVEYPYITINYGADNVLQDGKIQTKVWPREYYELLVQKVKEIYPEIKIVQLGSDDAKQIDGVDLYIFGKSLELSKYILQNSMCHIDCEGGLVHLATQLGTKCIVMFGPTPVWFYGYEQNINISPLVCGECQAAFPDWYTKCYKFKRAECMYSITPEYVFSQLDQYLQNNAVEGV